MVGMVAVGGRGVIVLAQLVDMMMQTLHVVMVWPLRLAHGLFATDNGYSVLAQGAIHVAAAVERLLRSR
jgi:hypothetical protein